MILVCAAAAKNSKNAVGNTLLNNAITKGKVPLAFVIYGSLLKRFTLDLGLLALCRPALAKTAFSAPL